MFKERENFNMMQPMSQFPPEPGFRQCVAFPSLAGWGLGSAKETCQQQRARLVFVPSHYPCDLRGHRHWREPLSW